MCSAVGRGRGFGRRQPADGGNCVGRRRVLALSEPVFYFSTDAVDANRGRSSNGVSPPIAAD